MKNLTHNMLLLLLALAVLALAGSCKSTATAPGARATITTNSPSRDSAAMAYQLMHNMWCSNDDAFSIVLLLFTGQDKCKDFAQRLELLKQKGLIDSTWKLSANKPVTKGTLAYMLCKGLGLKGGVMMHLLNVRRYAYREAVYEKLMQPGSENEPLSGPEVVGIMNRAGNYTHPN